MERLISAAGMVLLDNAMSQGRRFPWREVLRGMGLPFNFAVNILRIAAGKITFQWASDKLTAVVGFIQTLNFKTNDSK